MYISLRGYLKESRYRVAECIYHCVYIARRVFIKSRNGYIASFKSQGKLFYGYGMYTSLHVHFKEKLL